MLATLSLSPARIPPGIPDHAGERSAGEMPSEHLRLCGSDLGRTFLTSGLDLLIQFLQVLYTLSTQICLNERERGEGGGGEMEAEGKGERTRRKNC